MPPPQTMIGGAPFERYSTRGAARASGATGMPGRRPECAPTVQGAPRAGVIELEDPQGVVHHLDARDWDVENWGGHDLSVVWLVGQGDSSGPYVAVLDHATGAIQYNDRILARLSRPSLAPLVGLAAVVTLLEVWVGILVLTIGLGAWWLVGVRGRDRLRRGGTLMPVVEADADTE